MGTSMSGQSPHEADTRIVITAWSWCRARMDGPRRGGVSEDALTLRPRAVLFYTLPALFPALMQEVRSTVARSCAVLQETRT